MNKEKFQSKDFKIKKIERKAKTLYLQTDAYKKFRINMKYMDLNVSGIFNEFMIRVNALADKKENGEVIFKLEFNKNEK